VNFFSHAALASFERDDTAFVLGSMLPDFATMIRTRPPVSVHAPIEAGILYHHRTDDVFHDCNTFRELSHGAFDALQAAGVRRGSARAVAHVGVEILLDGALARDEHACRSYENALAEAHDSALGKHLRWPMPGDATRFAALRSALARRGVTAEWGTLPVVLERLIRTLSDRPRLAIEPGAEAPILTWLETVEPIVWARAPKLLAEVREGLAQKNAAP
jgi:hypothetical protein